MKVGDVIWVWAGISAPIIKIPETDLYILRSEQDIIMCYEYAPYQYKFWYTKEFDTSVL